MSPHIHALVEDPDDFDRSRCGAIEDQMARFAQATIAAPHVISCRPHLRMVDERLHPGVE
jgi:hypothetical protein